MATTLQARIQSLGQKLEEENESRRKEYPGKEKDKRSGRPKPPPDLRINPASRKPRPGINFYLAPNVRHLVPEIAGFCAVSVCCHYNLSTVQVL